MTIKENTMNLLLRQTLISNKVLCIFSIFFSIAIGVITGHLTPLLLQQLIENVGQTQSDLFWNSLLLFLGIHIFTQGTKVVRKSISTRLGIKFIYIVEDAFLNSWEQVYYRNYTYSNDSLFTMIRQNVVPATKDLILFLLDFIEQITLMVSAIVFLFQQSFSIFSLVIVSVLLVMIIIKKVSKPIPNFVKKWIDEQNVYRNKLRERIENREAGMFLNFSALKLGLDRQAEKVLEKELRFKIPNGIGSVLSFGFPYILLIMVGILGGILCIKGNMNYAALVSILSILPALATKIFSIPYLYSEYQSYYGRLMALDEAIPKINSHETEKCPKISSIVLDKLSFSYEEQPIFSKLSLSFEPGQWYAVAGSSGSGKTTLIHLILKKLPYLKGDIYISEVSLDKIERSSYWNKIAFISQKPIIINDSILKNIILDLPLDKEKLQSSLEDAGLTEFIARQSDGINTVINSKNVSSGELQKINFARVMYRDYDVLILDEATSAMDPSAELQIINSIKRRNLEDNKIVLFVSHRLSLLENADKVIFLNNKGETVVDSHENLLKQNILYQDVVIWS